MKSLSRIIGILVLLLVVFTITAIAHEDSFLTAYNMQNVILRTSLFGIISIGVAFVIITGGIDLSIGSVIGLVGCILAMLLRVDYVPSENYVELVSTDAKNRTIVVEGDIGQIERGDKLETPVDDETYEVTAVDLDTATFSINESISDLEPGMQMQILYASHMHPVFAIAIVLGISLLIGLAHGLLITKLGLQPFIVTLCGLLIYRGVARYLTDDDTQSFAMIFRDNLRQLAIGRIPITEDFGIPIPFLFLLALTIVAWIFLNKTVQGRYMLAVGRNETAARYSGIRTDRIVILAYVISAFLAGVGGVLFALNTNLVQPVNQGNFYELYAIAAAVLGGCSLRGGEGSILGVVIGAALMRLLNNAINIFGIPTHVEFAIVGSVILIGAITDEIVRRIAAARRARINAQQGG